MSGWCVLSPGDVGRDALHGFVGGVVGRALSARAALMDCSFALGVESSTGSTAFAAMAILSVFSKSARVYAVLLT